MKYRSNVSRLTNDDVHDWYRFVYAFSDQLVIDTARDFGIKEDDLVLDPFVGTGTTAVALKQLGINTVGIDASPASVLATQVKTNWMIDRGELRQRSNEILDFVGPIFQQISSGDNSSLSSLDDHYDGLNGDEKLLVQENLKGSDKIGKGWLSEKPFKKMQVLKNAVDQLDDDGITNAIRLAMIAILPEDVGNVKFGPEIYRTTPKDDAEVHTLFKNKIDKIERDLEKIQSSGSNFGRTEVLEGDARFIGDVLLDRSDLYEHHEKVDYIITSPPYPAEHDYTRQQRLELVWLDEILDNQDLRRIKKRNIRSNTKNIYVDDNDGDQTAIRDIDSIDKIVNKMEQIIEEEDIDHGFGHYYPRVIEEYFGGMQRHLEQIFDIIAPGGKAAYVVADQASYWQVEVATGEILAEIAADRVGFEVDGIKHWRDVTATTGKQKTLDEEILHLRKPAQ